MKKSYIVSDIAEIVQRINNDIKKFENKTVIITGATGFLGRYFCHTLILANKTFKSPCKIIAIDNFISSELDNEIQSDKNVLFIKGDVRDNPQVILKEIDNIDYIIYCAGIASPYRYKKEPLLTLEIITKGLTNYLELAKKTNAKVLAFSSSEIYGTPESSYIPTPETYPGKCDCLSDRSAYDESKRLTDTYMKIYHEMGVDVRTVRPFNVFGSFSKNDFRVINSFIIKILNDEPVQVYGDGLQTRTFCYITDAIVGFFKALLYGESGQTYNIGNDKPEVSMLDLVEILDDVVGYTIPRNIVNPSSDYPINGDPTRRCPDISKAAKAFNYKPEVSLEEGLRRYYQWAKENY
jgi:UDP-glucuronate decarboxylase